MTHLLPSYDVVILGGGPAGLAAAIAIRNTTSASVLLVERQSPGHVRLGENCPPNILPLLKKLGVEAEFYQASHEPCPGFASVWGRSSPGYNDFIVNPMGPSWRLNRVEFDAMLARKAEVLGVQLAWNTRFIGTAPNSSSQNDVFSSKQHRLHLKQASQPLPSVINAGFVIDATGSKARFARSLDIHKKIDDQLVATVRFATVAQGKGSKQIQLEATPQGWYYQALLPERKVVSMIVSERELMPELREHHHQGFENALTNTTFVGPSARKLTLEELNYRSCAILSGILPVLEGQNWMAIGDAAASFDPISAQGIYKGLSHGLLAAEKVAAWHSGASINEDYTKQVKAQFATYQRNRAHMYSLEQRWPDADFWKRRMR